jgi:hypothetical protein
VLPKPKLKQYEDFVVAESDALAEICGMVTTWDALGKKPLLSSAATGSASLFASRAVASNLWEILTPFYSSVPDLKDCEALGPARWPGGYRIQVVAFGKRISTKARRRVLAQLGLRTTSTASTQLGFLMDFDPKLKSGDGDMGALVRCCLSHLISPPAATPVPRLAVAPNARGPCPLTPELSQLLCNLGQIVTGDICFDPFCGTCTIGTAVHSQGGFFIGADLVPEPPTLSKIDVLRGNIFEQTRFPPNTFEAIVCDPPFGTRCKQHERHSGNEQEHINSHTNHWNHDSFVKRAVEQRFILEPLFDLAATALRPGGKLVFLFPNYPNNPDARWSHADLPKRENLDFLVVCRQEWLKSTGHCVSRDCIVFKKRP